MKQRFFITATFVVLVLLFMVPVAGTTEHYAEDTGKGCIFCHQESTGGQLKTAGFAYIRNGYHYPISESVLKKSEILQSPFHKTVRFIVGYIHLLAAVIFFGAIFYIHLFVRPARLTGGIPKRERVLGVSCMVVLALTGAYLTWVRIDRWENFFDNTFGFMLFTKIVLFILMVLIGITAITVINRKMRAESKAPPSDDKVALDNLYYFNGSKGRPAYFSYNNKVYDVTANTKWKDGRHFGKHSSGNDLTNELKSAPHGEEVLERVPCLGEIASELSAKGTSRPSQKIFIVMAYTNLVIVFLILSCVSVWRWDFPARLLAEKRPEAIIGGNCVECHSVKNPGIYQDWKSSVHAKVDVGCYKCHSTDNDELALKTHLKYHDKQITAVVSPETCRGCHPEQAEEYDQSKHANTIEIIWKIDLWLNNGMNNAIERTTGCYACHGTVVGVENGIPAEGTWPNVGVGRINPDGTKGSCTSCHTRHRFSIVEARKPEACGQCHLGPDHPQIEIYSESKHGTLYQAEGSSWDWDPVNGQWKAGEHYRAPTCASCHMSAADGVDATHDVTERISWETQAPRTVHPEDFSPYPATTHWQEERDKMKSICQQCHSSTWVDDHFRNLDEVIRNYDEIYYDPAKKTLDQLYEEGLASRDKYFDEEIEWQFYELWHHEGRRARMGAAMMAPDYAWWHGFYELKHRLNQIYSISEELKKEKCADMYENFPGQFIESGGSAEKE